MQHYAEFCALMEYVKIRAYNSPNVYRVEKTEEWTPEQGVEVSLEVSLNEPESKPIYLSSDGLFQSHSKEEIEELLA